MAHATGFLLLFLARKSRLKPLQYLFLTNLSLSEMLYLIGLILRRCLFYMKVETTSSIFYYSEIFFNTCVFSWYVLLLTLIAIDRFMEVYLHLRYHLFLSNRTAKIFLVAVFVISLFCMFVLLFIYDSYSDLRKFNEIYFWPFYEIMFLGVALMTYGYLLKKIRDNKLKTRRIAINLETSAIQLGSTKSNSNKEKVIKTRTHKKHTWFLFPSVFVGSFILFWLIPDFVIFLSSRAKFDLSEVTWFLLNLMYAFGMAIDAITYVIFSRHIRQFVRKYIRRFHQRISHRHTQD